MSEMIKLEINGIQIEVPKGTTILNAAKKVQVQIPKLCYHPDLPPRSACGVCVVKVAGSNKLIRACSAEVQPGMQVTTHDTELYNVRRTTIELILSTHPNDCLQCPRSVNCELQTLAAEFGIRELPYEIRLRNLQPDETTPSIVLNPEKCILCGRCATVCQQMQNVWALELLRRGEGTRIAPSADVCLNDSPCIKCGQCSAHCPVGAIYEKSDAKQVHEALADPDIIPVVQIAPAVRVAIGEGFDYPPGELLTGKTYAALRRLGFKAIFDTNFGADLTIMEEGTEFASRMLKGTGPLPLITSCCPAWTDYMEKFAPDFIDNFSTAKSPHEMLGSMAKTYFAEKIGVDPSRIYMVSIMPCTAKKYEITRTDEMNLQGHQHVDASLTTRELVRMIKSAGIRFRELKDEESDNILGTYSGAGTIFGATGGVMEAALRTAHYLICKEDMKDMNFTPVRGLEGVKEASIEIAGKEIRIAVAHWMSNIEIVLNAIRESRKKGEEPPYHFIEVMACRGGCVGGGGQPYGATDEIRRQRAAGLYCDDLAQTYRCSHHNPDIKQLYADYLGEPLSPKAHELLHRKYQARDPYRT